MKRFVQAVIDILGENYLRRPNNDDISRLLAEGETRGFPGTLGSIDCMHWKWKNCLVAWKGMYARGDHCDPSLILEVVASKDLLIWQAFFGFPGSHNDINVGWQRLIPLQNEEKHGLHKNTRAPWTSPTWPFCCFKPCKVMAQA
ncbi:hypothetical protein L3X38_024219 [Prunus dulcis]|uniref:Uncharacterized protein n=1 Tax=Prunus dulcis TaxID=3755 RepID=A0AAD4Z678_PRUDU|nr:hypothetical protein L3X38_024219 [Prunus dulcis]